MNAARKRALPRATTIEAPIDPALPGARGRILARFPAPLRGIQAAPREAVALVAEYVEARDLASACEADKEVAGNALALLVADSEGIAGDGFQVTWAPTVGRVNWEALARFLMGYTGTEPWARSEAEIAEKLAAWRGAPTRTLRVTLASGARR